MRAAILGGVLVAVCGAGCSDDDPCTAPLPRDCSPLYAPDYDEIFTRRLRTTCGAASTGAACHASAGAMGGLVFEDPDSAYDLLLGTADGRARVLPEDPECSPLIKRIESRNPDRVMPPGAQLSEEERCAFILWVAEGAAR